MTKELSKELLNEIIKLAPPLKKEIMRPGDAVYKNRLSHLQSITIMMLLKNEGLSLNSLAVAHGISKQQMSKIIDSMVQLDFIERKINPHSRREVQIYISESGKQYIAKMQNKAIEKLSERLQNRSDAEIIEIIEHFRAINNIFAQIFGSR